MKPFLPAAALVAVLAVPADAATVGAPAPAFTLPDATGRPVSLADFKGRTVVLEWNNPGCPFVRKHYDSRNMQKTQAAAIRAGAVWLTINSGAPGKQGYMTAAGAKALLAKEKSQPTAYLLDPDGTVGRLYDAKTTPHMYIVSRTGTLIYAGGIDDKPTPSQADIGGARNHVLAALADIGAGRPVAVASSRPYGCSVKYSGS